MRLSQEISEDDVLRAIAVTKEFMKLVACDSGIFDIDLIATGVGHAQRSRIIWLLDIIDMFTTRTKEGIADKDDILDEAEEKGYDRDMIKQDLEKLRREGRIFNVKNGYRKV
jgi:replicative DNA helicase Mcm